MTARAPGLAAALSVLLATSAAGAVKRRFEPTDLELEDAGVLEADIQVGPVQSDGPMRIVFPDAEIDLGLAPNIELDVDFTLGLEGPLRGPYSVDHTVTDNTWIAAKLGLLDVRDPAAGTAWALGVQLGPKLPLAGDARGTGYEALFLVGRTMGRWHLVLNAGGLVDPGADISRKRPIGAVAGLDLQVDLPHDVAILGEIGTVLYVSGDPHELAGTLGVQWSPTATLDLSVVGLVGLPPGSDRYGLLLGVARKFQLWR
jgi:hypothetical protein